MLKLLNRLLDYLFAKNKNLRAQEVLLVFTLLEVLKNSKLLSRLLDYLFAFCGGMRLLPFRTRISAKTQEQKYSYCSKSILTFLLCKKKVKKKIIERKQMKKLKEHVQV